MAKIELVFCWGCASRFSAKRNSCPACDLPVGQCAHGYSERLQNCATCHKRADECSWGACQDKDVRDYKRMKDGRHVETIKLCGDHVRLALQLDGCVYSG